MNAAMLMVCIAGSAVGQSSEVVSKAPRIEIRTETRDGKTFSYLLYNRIYMGRQYHNSKLEPKLSRLPTTYYHDKGPIGLVLTDAKSFPPKAEPPVLVLGMEIGTLASYAQPGQTFHFTERVPIFVKLSRPDKGEKPRFTFIQDALDRGAKVKIFEGEPREMLEKHGANKFYKVIAVEACKVPDDEIHKELLTKEALQLLMSKLTDDGIVCYHTSDRYYQLAPIIASAARELKLACTFARDDQFRDDPKDEFRFSSEWVMVARAEKHLAHLKKDERHRVDWGEPTVRIDVRGKLTEKEFDKQFLWTDKGEQSFRGLYYSDPEIDKLRDVVWDAQQFFTDSVGVSQQRMWQVSRPVHGLIRAWSQASADRMNRDSPLASEAVSKTPRIEIKTGESNGKTFSYLLYNRVYMGRQYHNSKLEPKLSRLPTTYFHDKSPIGLVLTDAKSFPPKAEPPVMVLGMDIGTLASYAQPGQTFHFTERVPAFVKFSRPDKGEKPKFTFIQDALERGAKVKVFEGEPREMLEKHGANSFYKVIVIETYKLPVIEVHKELLTKEALQLFMSKLTDDGIVCYHTSNRYYQMAPIIASAARELKLACILGRDTPDYDDRKNDFRYSSEWVMVARSEKHLAHLKNDKRHGVDWGEPTVRNIVRGRLIVTKFDKQFLWTDKGEQSFRGLYYSDPEIDKLDDVVNDVAEFLNDSVGIPYQRTNQVNRSVRDLIRAWSKSSADRMNRDSPLATKGKNAEKK